MDELNKTNLTTEESDSNSEDVISEVIEEPAVESVEELSEQEPAVSAAEMVLQAEKKHERVALGIIGAAILSLVGGALYFIIYRMGYIAGICGLVTVLLAIWGYKKLAGVSSVKGVVISIIFSVIAIFLGEFLGLSYEIYEVYKVDYQITFMDAVMVTPSFLVDPGILPSVFKDLGMAYLFGAIASFTYIKKSIAESKQ